MNSNKIIIILFFMFLFGLQAQSQEKYILKKDKTEILEVDKKGTEIILSNEKIDFLYFYKFYPNNVISKNDSYSIKWEIEKSSNVKLFLADSTQILDDLIISSEKKIIIKLSKENIGKSFVEIKIGNTSYLRLNFKKKENCLDFLEINNKNPNFSTSLNESQNQEIIMKNIGKTTINISFDKFKNKQFTIDKNNFSLNPNKEEKIIITFKPSKNDYVNKIFSEKLKIKCDNQYYSAINVYASIIEKKGLDLFNKKQIIFDTKIFEEQTDSIELFNLSETETITITHNLNGDKNFVLNEKINIPPKDSYYLKVTFKSQSFEKKIVDLNLTDNFSNTVKIKLTGKVTEDKDEIYFIQTKDPYYQIKKFEANKKKTYSLKHKGSEWIPDNKTNLKYFKFIDLGNNKIKITFIKPQKYEEEYIDTLILKSNNKTDWAYIILKAKTKTSFNLIDNSLINFGRVHETCRDTLIFNSFGETNILIAKEPFSDTLFSILFNDKEVKNKLTLKNGENKIVFIFNIPKNIETKQKFDCIYTFENKDNKEDKKNKIMIKLKAIYKPK